MSNGFDIHAKAEVLLEALPYFQRFQGSVFVVKVGGSFLEAPGALDRVATDVAFLATVGIRVVVVHGGGKAISRAMAEAAIEPVFRGGLRVTDAQTVAIVEKTLNGVINREIVDKVAAAGAPSTGVFGQEAFTCTRLAQDAAGHPVDLGFVGEVCEVSTREVEAVFEKGGVPVVSPVAQDRSGQFYNVNADVAAAHLAIALQARRLVYLCDVPGLMRDPKDHATLISTLKSSEVDTLKATGVIGSGMMPKVDSALQAIRRGVHRAHFIDGQLAHSILLEIFTDKGIGTEIVHDVSAA
ncbi:MAG: acetylglutamate kinase [Opitutales bacterium]